MLKKNQTILSLYLFLSCFHIQPTPEDANAALGVGIFLFTTTTMAIRARNKSYEMKLKKDAHATHTNVIELQQPSNSTPHTIPHIFDRRVNQRYDYDIIKKKEINRLPYAIRSQSEIRNQEQLIVMPISSNTKLDYIVLAPEQLHILQREEEEQQNIAKNNLKQNIRDQRNRKLILEDINNQKKLRPRQDFLRELTHVTTKKATLQELTNVTYLQDINPLKTILDARVLHMPCNEAEHIFLDTRDTNKVITVSTERTFIPRNSNTKKVIYIPVIHGTFATNGKSLGDDESHTITEAMICQAQRIALEQDAVVKLFVIKWNGEYKEKSRNDAGKSLANAMIKTIQKEDHAAQISLQVIAHSYGCDVARTMIDEMHNRNQNIHFDSAYFLASPPTNIDVSGIIKDYHIYGDLDGIATAEAYRLSNRTSTSIHNPHAHMNIKLVSSNEVNDKHNHKTIKYSGIRYLSSLLQSAQEFAGQKAVTATIYKNDLQSTADEGEFDLSSVNDLSTYTIIMNSDPKPYQMRSWTDALASEAQSTGLDIDGFLVQIGLKIIAGIENYFGNAQQPTSSDSSSSPVSVTTNVSPIHNADETKLGDSTWSTVSTSELDQTT